MMSEETNQPNKPTTAALDPALLDGCDASERLAFNLGMLASEERAARAICLALGPEEEAGRSTVMLWSLLYLRIGVMGELLQRIAIDAESLTPASQAMKEVAVAVYGPANEFYQRIKEILDKRDALIAPVSDKTQ
jgi:hypothetical protein